VKAIAKAHLVQGKPLFDKGFPHAYFSTPNLIHAQMQFHGGNPLYSRAREGK
jgi:hypothetical protein